MSSANDRDCSGKRRTRAAGLGEEEACALLTEFDRGRAEAAILTLQRLLPEVKTLVFREEF
jgi:hypothetical protein